jgi:hypothetical protein
MQNQIFAYLVKKKFDKFEGEIVWTERFMLETPNVARSKQT